MSHTMEAGLGAVWAEDLRYFRDADAPFKNRLAHVFKMVFVARNRDGDLMPAYARFIAIPSSSALASTWRPESERSVGNVGARIGLGVLGRRGPDAFTEFWPDVRRHILRRKPASAAARRGLTALRRIDHKSVILSTRSSLLSRFGNHL